MNMRTRRRILSLACLFALGVASAQQVSRVVKIGELMAMISHPDTTYVVNFWATWCKPCVDELPAFDSLHVKSQGKAVKVLLVSLDFSEDIGKKVNPFLAKREQKARCVLLDEPDGNRFINLISKDWSGAIPGTLIKKGKTHVFLEKKLKLKDLENNVAVIGSP
jgi:thiol-disulfide isomerase/thioredoxin